MIQYPEAIKKERDYLFLGELGGSFRQLTCQLVPTCAIKGMQKEGAGFAGVAAWLDMTLAHLDMFAIPDPDSLIQLPWKPEIGWVGSDLWMSGNPVGASPRVALKRQLGKAQNQGIRMKTGVDCEYHLVNPNDIDITDTEAKPCYGKMALMRQ